MAANASVQYNGGLLPDIILLTLCDYIGENSFDTMKKRFCPYSQCSHLNILTIFNFSPEGGCSEGLDAFRFLLKTSPWLT